MKSLLSIFVSVLLVFAALACQAEGLRLSSVYVGSGKGVLSEGLNTAVEIVGGELKITAIADNSQIYGLFRFKQVGPLDLVATGGEFQNTPWLGPKVDLNFTSQLSLTSWWAWQAGQVGDPQWTADFFSAYHCLCLDCPHWMASYAIMHYQWFAPKHIISAKAKFPILETLRLDVSCDYVASPLAETLFGAGFRYEF